MLRGSISRWQTPPHQPDRDPARRARRPRTRPTMHAPVTPGKVAMWLFLATEVMFFTGLIGSYIVLRAGSSAHGVQQPLPADDRRSRSCEDTAGVVLESAGNQREQVEQILIKRGPESDRGAAEKIVEQAPHGMVVSGLPDGEGRGARTRSSRPPAPTAEVEPLKTLQLAQALRRADQPAGDQPDRGQHVRADLLVGHDGAGPLGHPAGQSRASASFFLGPRSSSAASSWASRSTNITS